MGQGHQIPLAAQRATVALPRRAGVPLRHDVPYRGGTGSRGSPAIATGVYGFPRERSARIAAHTIASPPTNVVVVRLVACDEATRDLLAAALALNAVPGIPPELRDVLYTCVARDPDDRFKNAAVLEQKLIDSCRVAGQRASRKQNVLWLGMTRTAAAAVLQAEPLQEADFRRAEAAILGDLGEILHADYGYDSQNQRVDKKRLRLAGRSMMVWVAPDDQYDERVRIIKAAVKDDDWLRRWREKAVDLSRLLTLRFDDPGPDAAWAGLDFVLDRLDEDQERKRAAAQEPAKTDTQVHGDLYEQWGRLLDAREALERGERKPIAYTGITQRGRNTTFHLPTPHETPLVGEEWEVAHSAQGYPIDRGEVIEQSEDGICVQFRKHTSKVPRSGVLVPYLGPSKVALQRQQDALVSVRTGRTANPRLDGMLQDPAALRAGTPADAIDWSRANLDKSKQDVVRRALGSQDLLLVQGQTFPPQIDPDRQAIIDVLTATEPQALTE